MLMVNHLFCSLKDCSQFFFLFFFFFFSFFFFDRFKRGLKIVGDHYEIP